MAVRILLSTSDEHAAVRAARWLADDLRAARVTVRHPQVEAGAGTKAGQAAGLTELLLTGGLSAAAVTAVATVVVGFLQRGAARAMTIVDGDRRIELTGVSAAEQRAALEAFLAQAATGAAGPGGAPAAEPGSAGD